MNSPAIAEDLLDRGIADLVGMARALLADPQLPNKAASGRESQINTCIACNQACLDLVFEGGQATCLVNPQALRETELVYRPAFRTKNLAVVGAGPAGLACAAVAAERGHQVTLFEQESEIGGQFRYARKVPGKEDFQETLRYFSARLSALGVKVVLSSRACRETLLEGGYDEIVLASGVVPRSPRIPGIDHPMVIPYADLLSGRRVAGMRVAIIGSGGIGFDAATFLTLRPILDGPDAVLEFCDEWGIDPRIRMPGGLLPQAGASGTRRKVYLLQRKLSPPGLHLGATTGWARMRSLVKYGVEMLTGIEYLGIDAAGLHLQTANGPQILEVDSVVVCAGQEPRNELVSELSSLVHLHVIGGAARTAGLDAARAIREGTELGARL